MPLEHAIVHRDGYSLVLLTGAPSLGEFVSFVQLIAVQTRSWAHERVLFGLRRISTLRTMTEHLAIGHAVAQHMQHLHRIASVVPQDRATGISRKVARAAGVSLSVFVEEAAAIHWLLEREA